MLFLGSTSILFTLLHPKFHEMLKIILLLISSILIASHFNVIAKNNNVEDAQNLVQNQNSSFGWGIQAPTRIPSTPFGSTERDITNWNKYTEAQRCSNPTAFGC